MCGILGIVHKNKPVEPLEFKNALSTLARRGPDSINIFNDHQLSLGHTRLSIIDLETGQQPMLSQCENYIIVFNGEIYNYQELKGKYTYQYQTHSDTEVLLAGYITKGADFLNDLEGMFSFCIYDKIKNKLFLARDPFGIKPLLFSFDDYTFAFSSEIKALLPLLPKQKINQNSIFEFFTRKFIPAPFTIYEGILKLKSGHYIDVDLQTLSCKVVQYFDFDNVKNNNFEDSHQNVKDSLIGSIQKHLISDVPVSSFLSGGIDSTIIAYEAQKILGNLETFTIGFENNGDNEDLKFSRIAANFIKSNHHEIIVNSIGLDEFVDLLDYFDEPFADTAILANYLVAKEVSASSKVVLSGDGGDELFYGYNAYFRLAKLSKIGFTSLQNLPVPIALSLHPRYKQLVDYTEQDVNELYRSLYYNMPSFLFRKIFKNTNYSFSDFLHSETTPKHFRDYDLKVNLPEYYLTKVDKISMINSLEVRVPFLDKNVLKSIANIEYKQHYDIHNIGKTILRENYLHELPQEILYRKKQGFIRSWKSLLKNDLNELFVCYFNQDFFEKFNIDHSFVVFCQKNMNEVAENILWRLLVLAIWYDKNKSSLL